MDIERWLDPPNSEEVFPSNPRRGRVDTKLKQRLSDVIQLTEPLQGQAKSPEQQANLSWLRANLGFTLLLDEVGGKIEPAYELKNRWLSGKVDPTQLGQEIKRAKADLAAAPIRELLTTVRRQRKLAGRARRAQLAQSEAVASDSRVGGVRGFPGGSDKAIILTLS